MANWSEKRVLFSVLDWGLGHAARSAVLIDELLRNRTTLFLASRGSAAAFLARRYPELPIFQFPDKEIKYHRSGAWAALLQRSLVQRGINSAQEQWARSMVEKHEISHLISDNVYGTNHPDRPSALISHQLHLPSPFAASAVNRELKKWLSRFSEIWIPDQTGDLALSGNLSVHHRLEIPQYRLGILSRFRKNSSGKEPLDILAFSSGVESQVSVFEEKLVRSLSSLPGNILLAGSGKFLSSRASSLPFRTLVGSDEELMEALGRARFVICRSGFSSLSDLVAAQKPALIIPTPGQAEQGYLAIRGREMGWFHTASQEKLSADVIEKAMKENLPCLVKEPAMYAETIRRFLR